jgi:enoyl-CoA hydratase
MKSAKRIITESRYATAEARFAAQEEIVAPLRSGPEAREGALAFVERRDPAWVVAAQGNHGD